MPPRRAPPSSTTSTPRPKKPSKAAQRLSLTHDQESSIHDAFTLFDPDNIGEIATSDVRMPMRALGFESTREELQSIIRTLDPDKEGVVEWEIFLEVMSLKLQTRDIHAEVQRAFTLFDDTGKGIITLDDLRRVARELGEEGKVSDNELRDMLEIASGRGDGVRLEEFEGVMGRAGVL